MSRMVASHRLTKTLSSVMQHVTAWYRSDWYSCLCKIKFKIFKFQLISIFYFILSEIRTSDLKHYSPGFWPLDHDWYDGYGGNMGPYSIAQVNPPFTHPSPKDARSPLRPTIRVNRTKTLITGVSFISYAKTVMQFILLLGLSCKQIHAWIHAEYRHALCRLPTPHVE
jgi:hypothetical protein